jgi:hypothetical protein
MFHCCQETHRFHNNSTGRACAGNFNLLTASVSLLHYLCVCTISLLLILLLLQNWVSFGKVAHDLVMRMQKIDGDNYPEVV